MIELILSASIFFTPNDTFYVRGEEGAASWFCRYDGETPMPALKYTRSLTRAQMYPSPLRGEFELTHVSEVPGKTEYSYSFGEPIGKHWRYWVPISKRGRMGEMEPFRASIHDASEYAEWYKSHGGSGGRMGITNYECVQLKATERGSNDAENDNAR